MRGSVMETTESQKVGLLTRVLQSILWLPLLLSSLWVSSLFAPGPGASPSLNWILLSSLVVLALVMVVLVLTSRRPLIQIIVGLLAFASAGGTWYFFRGPTVVYETIRATLTVKDKEGRGAHLSQQDRLLALRDGLSAFWQIDVGSPGQTVQNFAVNYKDFKLLNQYVRQRGLGLYDIKTRVSPPAKKGQTIERTLDFDVIGQPSDEDGHILPIRAVTQDAEVVLEMPEGRSCTQASVQVDGRASSSEPQPQIVNGGRRVVWRKANPELGREYTIMCYHTKAGSVPNPVEK